MLPNGALAMASTGAPAHSAHGKGGNSALQPCTPMLTKRLADLVRRPSMGSTLVVGDTAHRREGRGSSHGTFVLEDMSHFEQHRVDGRNATPGRIRGWLDQLTSPLVYLEVDAQPDHVLAHLPLAPPTRHRPVAIAILTEQRSSEHVRRARAHLRLAGYAHQCLSGSRIVSTTSCPVPATELRFNSILSGLFEERLVPSGHVLDAGANTGEFACFYAGLDPRRKVHALDPNAKYVQKMRTVFASRWPNMHAEMRGLGFTTGVIGQHSKRNGNEAAIATLCAGGADRFPTHEQISSSDPVAVCRVDDLFANQPLAFAHWDVEGSELDVLRGARTVVKRDRPLFSVELHVHEDSGYTERLLREIEGLGYDAHLIEERCGSRADCRNFLCTPSERRDVLGSSATMRRAVASGWLLPANRSSIGVLAYPCCARGGACPNCSPSEVDSWLETQVRSWEAGGRRSGPDPRTLYTSEPWDRTTPPSKMDGWAKDYSTQGGNRLSRTDAKVRNASSAATESPPPAGCEVNTEAACKLFGLDPQVHRPADWMPILFVHISTATSLLPLEECVIKSAARHNPRFQVLVVSNSLQPPLGAFAGSLVGGFPLHPYDATMAALPFPPRCVRLKYEDALEETLLHRWYRDHGRNRSNVHMNVILADVLRLALLYKIGGAYLDLDMLSVAPLPADSLEHSVGMQLHATNNTGKGWRTMMMPNNAALLFRCPRSAILRALMSSFVRKYEPHVWGTGGPVLFTRVWKAWNTRNVSAYAAVANLTVLPIPVFYPLHWWDRSKFHSPEAKGAAAAVLKPGVTVGVHLWNKVYNNGTGSKWQEDSFATRFVRERCGGWAPPGR